MNQIHRALSWQAASILERLARWEATVSRPESGDILSSQRVVCVLRDKRDALWVRLEPCWSRLARYLQGAVTYDCEDHAILAEFRECDHELARLERALAKVQGLCKGPEIDDVLRECAPKGVPLPPVVLVPTETELDEDGFLPLPFSQLWAPLNWPTLAYAAQMGYQAGSEVSAYSRDLAAASQLGPAYLFCLVDRAGRACALGEWELLHSLAQRVRRVALILGQHELLAFEARVAAELVGFWSSTQQTPSEPMELETEQAPVVNYGFEDVALAEQAASRFNLGILASAHSSVDFSQIRILRDQLLARPSAEPEEVYAVLSHLKEEPLGAVAILNGAWLFRRRMEPVWLEAALNRDGVSRFGERVLALDALVLKSLETASVHRRMICR